MVNSLNKSHLGFLAPLITANCTKYIFVACKVSSMYMYQCVPVLDTSSIENLPSISLYKGVRNLLYWCISYLYYLPNFDHRWNHQHQSNVSAIDTKTTSCLWKTANSSNRQNNWCQSFNPLVTDITHSSAHLSLTDKFTKIQLCPTQQQQLQPQL